MRFLFLLLIPRVGATYLTWNAFSAQACCPSCLVTDFAQGQNLTISDPAWLGLERDVFPSVLNATTDGVAQALVFQDGTLVNTTSFPVDMSNLTGDLALGVWLVNATFLLVDRTPRGAPLSVITGFTENWPDLTITLSPSDFPDCVLPDTFTFCGSPFVAKGCGVPGERTWIGSCRNENSTPPLACGGDALFPTVQLEGDRTASVSVTTVVVSATAGILGVGGLTSGIVVFARTLEFAGQASQVVGTAGREPSSGFPRIFRRKR